MIIINRATPQKSSASVCKPQETGPCNLSMPNNSVYARFMWYLRLLTYNGFVVVIDNHLNTDPTIIQDVNLWVKVIHIFWSFFVLMITFVLDSYLALNQSCNGTSLGSGKFCKVCS